MIRAAWEGKEFSGVNTHRVAKLTDEHFDKNGHNYMIVFLAVQVLSISVYGLIEKYVEGDDVLSKEYSSLLLLVEKMNHLVDIWNHPSRKKVECISIPGHAYLKNGKKNTEQTHGNLSVAKFITTCVG